VFFLHAPLVQLKGFGSKTAARSEVLSFFGSYKGLILGFGQFRPKGSGAWRVSSGKGK